jgi:hypothetical protein
MGARRVVNENAVITGSTCSAIILLAMPCLHLWNLGWLLAICMIARGQERYQPVRDDAFPPGTAYTRYHTRDDIATCVGCGVQLAVHQLYTRVRADQARKTPLTSVSQMFS